MAVGYLAIRRLAVGKASIRSLEVEDLNSNFFPTTDSPCVSVVHQCASFFRDIQPNKRSHDLEGAHRHWLHGRKSECASSYLRIRTRFGTTLSKIHLFPYFTECPQA